MRVDGDETAVGDDAAAGQLPYKWIADADARWHRVASVSAGAAATLCDLTLDETGETRWEPPPEGATRCRSCEIEGEGAPPNH